MSDKLEPCPFCRQMPVVDTDMPWSEEEGAWDVTCMNDDCLVYTCVTNKSYGAKDDAIATWNAAIAKARENLHKHEDK